LKKNAKKEIARMGESIVKADVAKNRLYLSAEGFLTPEQNQESGDRVIAELNKLKPGFDMITDLSKMEVTTQEGLQTFARLSKSFEAMNRKRSIVVMDDAIARMQIGRTGRETGRQAEYAASVEEAERILDVGK